MTFKKAKILGGNVRKGETGATIFYVYAVSVVSDNESQEYNKTQEAKENKRG